MSEYEFQLGQVLEALEIDPTNRELLTLKGDLEEIILLSKEIKPIKVHKQSTLVTKEVEVDEYKLNVDSLRLGDKCQIRIEGGGWIEACVSFISADGYKFVVITAKTNETKNVSREDIRPFSSKPIKIPAVLSCPQNSTVVSRPKVDLEIKKKKAKSRQEYIMKKETEHGNKAKIWNSFQAKLSKKSTPSLFKGRESVFKTPRATTTFTSVNSTSNSQPKRFRTSSDSYVDQTDI